MGYDFKAADSGLNVKIDWPSSDLEMIEASVNDYINSKEPFHAYYMTFSGHYQYNWDNAMSAKNKAAVEDLPYSEPVKAYIACNLELEYALQYLMQQLEAAGIADKTCIVLTNDHYPYGLTEEEYNELAGQTLDTKFEKYRNSFICYVPGLSENIVVDEYCSTADILPTLLNLFGVEYDSRLLAGTDVLSSGVHIAMLSNRSFLTKTFRYDADTETVIPANDSIVISDELLHAYCLYVDNKFKVSSNIVNSDYYAHGFNKEPSGGSLKDTVVFTDIKSIFNQASVLYMYRNGYVDPESPDNFGGQSTAKLGEFVDVLYRIAGRPETDNSPAARLREPLLQRLLSLLRCRLLGLSDTDPAPERPAVHRLRRENGLSRRLHADLPLCCSCRDQHQCGSVPAPAGDERQLEPHKRSRQGHALVQPEGHHLARQQPRRAA